MSLPRPSGTIFLSSSLSPRHTATHGAREQSAGNERLSPCTRARYQDASKRTRSRVSARSRPPRSPQKFARENRSRDPPLPHEHRLTLANVKWRPLLTSFSTLVRIARLLTRRQWPWRQTVPAIGRAGHVTRRACAIGRLTRGGQERRGYIHAASARASAADRSSFPWRPFRARNHGRLPTRPGEARTPALRPLSAGSPRDRQEIALLSRPDARDRDDPSRCTSIETYFGEEVTLCRARIFSTTRTAFFSIFFSSFVPPEGGIS